MNAKNATARDRAAVSDLRRWMKALEAQASGRLDELRAAFGQPVTVSEWHAVSHLVRFSKLAGSAITYNRIERLVRLGFFEKRSTDGYGIEIRNPA